ncbi:GNAT family N-acetyltransferase [Terrisporobacter sp.]|uniref:GNAT family N-acetyltransferase n=1 Tax=Terrisporobacter sp. TaxID=1965305 RepID=UPI002604AF63|nr:GNAT family N-acetyltransferase [Terrisporobacter sp.]
MNIRFARENEKDNIREIWDYCFNDGPKFTDYYFEDKYDNKNTVVVEDENEIVSSLQLNQYKLVLNGNLYDTSYVVGVSTFPQVRGKGYMKNIMDFTLNELYKKKQLVSILMPIDYRLYRKYGYEHCYDQLEYELDIEDLRVFKSSGDMKKANKSHIEEMIEIQESFLKNLNGNIKRDKSYYENLFKEVSSEDGHIYIHQGDRSRGYIIYFINGENMFVRELYYTSLESLKAILKFIYNHNTQCKKVTISAPVNDNIRFILANPRTASIKLKPFMMGRVINFEEYLKTLHIKNYVEGSLNISIKDEFIKENNNVFKINLENNKLSVEKGEFTPHVEFDINTISQLAFSYIDGREAFLLNNLEEDENVIEFLNSIFVKKENYINEYI